ncbi:MAG: Glycosyl transferase, family 2, partial [uncultured Solirubrobacteraceae bacterium]
DLHPPQRALDLPDLLDVRAAARLHDGRVPVRDRGARPVRPLRLLLPDGRRRGERAVADPRRRAVQRGDAARGARRDRRPALGPADHAPAHLRARASRRARARRRAFALRARRQADRPARHHGRRRCAAHGPYRGARGDQGM